MGHGHLVLIKNLRPLSLEQKLRMFTVKILTWKDFLQLQMLRCNKDISNQNQESQKN